MTDNDTRANVLAAVFNLSQAHPDLGMFELIALVHKVTDAPEECILGAVRLLQEENVIKLPSAVSWV